MTQPDMFDTFTRSGTSIVPPTPDELARRKRDRGIKRVADHVDAVDPAWREKALGYVRLHAIAHAEFLAEDVRAMAEHDGLAPPPDGRAWGSVMQRAARDGVIKRIGYAPARSSNLSPKVKWGRA